MAGGLARALVGTGAFPSNPGAHACHTDPLAMTIVVSFFYPVVRCPCGVLPPISSGLPGWPSSCPPAAPTDAKLLLRWLRSQQGLLDQGQDQFSLACCALSLALELCSADSARKHLNTPLPTGPGHPEGNGRGGRGQGSEVRRKAKRAKLATVQAQALPQSLAAAAAAAAGMAAAEALWRQFVRSAPPQSDDSSGD